MRHALFILLILLACESAWAQRLSLDVEATRTDGVGAAWVGVATLNTYTSPVVACTYNLPSVSSPPATVRMRNAGPAGFEIRLQQFEQSDVVTPGTVHCLVVDEGVHVLADGREIEAHTVVSTRTANGNPNSNWNGRTENVTASLGHAYTTMVVLGQVMTFNDVRASVFWTHDGQARGNSPTPARFFVGKHTGQSNVARTDEVLGFITAEAGSGTVNGVDYVFGSGADSVAGTANNPPYLYALPTGSVDNDYDTAIATQNAEDGGNGGWAVLYGNDPLPPSRIGLAVEEEVFDGDTSRGHTTEPVFYAAFADNRTAEIAADKAVLDTGYALPGAVITYTITAKNSGTASTDAGSVFIVDRLPSELVARTAPGSITANLGSSGLTFDPSTDLAWSDAITPPASFADCLYVPATPQDAAIRHICLRPGGRLSEGTFTTTDPATFTIQAVLQ